MLRIPPIHAPAQMPTASSSRVAHSAVKNGSARTPSINGMRILSGTYTARRTSLAFSVSRTTSCHASSLADGIRDRFRRDDVVVRIRLGDEAGGLVKLDRAQDPDLARHRIRGDRRRTVHVQG